jgi:hypothetical protein
MAGPVKWFRKNKKQSLAILTILTVLSFVFLPVMLEILSLRGGTRDPLVVTTKKYGNLRDGELNAIAVQRGRLSGFLQELQRQVAARNMGPFLFVAQNGFLLIPNREGGVIPVPAEDGLYLVVDGRLERLASQNEEGAVEMWLARNKAREMGIVTSQPAIRELLGQWARRIDSNTLAKLASSFSLSPSQLFDALGSELSAIRVGSILKTSLGNSIGDMTPAQRWDYFLRLKRSARIEAVPIDVEKLIAQVPDPTAAEEKDLKALFEQYRENRPNPSSPEPGFRELHQVVVQYFKADMKAFLDPRQVTDEEILKYYDDHKQDTYTHLVTPDFVKVPPAAANPKSEVPNPKQIPNPKTEVPKPKAEVPSPKAEVPSPKTETPIPNPKSEVPQGPPSKPGAAEKTAPKTSATESRDPAPLRLVSFLKEEEKTASQTKPKTEATAPPPVNGNPPPAGAAAAKTEAAAPPPAKGNPPPAGAVAAKTEAAAPKTGTPPAKPEPPPRPRFEVTPLEKVKDEIRGILAKEKAKEKMVKALEAVQKAMGDFDQNQWMLYDQLPEKEKKQTPAPETPTEGLTRIAKANRLDVGCTGWISELDVPQWDIGKSRVEGGAWFAERAFSQGRLYQSMTSEDSDGNQYVFWKVDDYPERVPQWGDPDVRDRVVYAWKLDKARKLARQEAESIAAKARESQKPLKEVIATLGGTGVSPVQLSTGKMPVPPTMLTAGPFTWLVDTGMGGAFASARPSYGVVLGTDGKPIPYLRNPFMERVFAIPPGGTDWAENDPQTVVYVVRVIEYKPMESTLWEEFLVEHLGAYQIAAVDDQAASDKAWRKELEAEAGLQWRREAARGRAEAADADFD